MWGGGDTQTPLGGEKILNFMHSWVVGMQKLSNFLHTSAPYEPPGETFTT